MCGFLVTNRVIDDLDHVTAYLARRGPDGRTVHHRNGVTFVHFLLAITGEKTPQPFVEDGVVCVYNGEIYNAGDYASDGECLIPAYRRHGVTFNRHLDGEFAIALIDFNEQRVLFYTDTFGTKPLYVARDGAEWGISSYRSALERLGFRDVTHVRPAGYDFSLQQFKTNYDDWIAAFERAVKKRLSDKGMFIGLSSGYDSGAIDCALRKLGAGHTAFTVGTEHCEGRQSIRLPFRHMDLSLVEPNTFYDMPADLGSHGLAQICEEASNRGLRVSISGQGADETMTDYSRKRVFDIVQTLGGHFFVGHQKRFLSKEEHVAGAYGIETRYPYLDREVVQEFLWLTPELKNAHFKAPLHEYLSRNHYPFIPGEKLGFGMGIQKGLPPVRRSFSTRVAGRLRRLIRAAG